MNQYILGKAPLGSKFAAISMAASWAWGVSVVVGMQIIQNKGLPAFLIWATANALALTVFGIIATRATPVVRLADVMRGWVARVYLVVSILIQFFSILVNMTAVKTACAMLGMPEYAWMLISLAVMIPVWFFGFSQATANNLLLFALWMVLLLVGGVIGLQNETQAPLPFVSTYTDILWALYGAVILLSAPVMDQQMWQRRAAMRDKCGINSFMMASTLFAFYMALVALSAYSNAPQWIIAVVILGVSSATLASAVSAISSVAQKTMTSRLLSFAIAMAAFALMVFNLPVLTLWVLYGSARIPFAIYVVFRVLHHDARTH